MPRATKTDVKPNRNPVRRAKSTAKPAETTVAAAPVKGSAAWADSYNATQAAYMAEKRAAARDLKIPPCANPERRAAAEVSTRTWLATYCPEFFAGELDPQIEGLIDDYDEIVTYGGDQATAASRGIGKSTLVWWATIGYMLRGMLDFVLLLSANGDKATENLTNIKGILLNTLALREDYPEVVVPLNDLRGAPSKRNGQTVGGVNTDPEWGADTIVFPTVAGSKSSGFVLRSLSIDSGQIRGTNHKGRRPKVVVPDDPETAAAAVSEIEVASCERKIDFDVGGLGTSERPVSRFIITTCQNRTCASWKYTDVQQKPSFQGRRWAWITKWPTHRETHWRVYVEMRQEDMKLGDRFGRRAHQYFIDHFDLMMLGAECSSKRHNSTMLRDGSQMELNSLQHAFNEIADKGLKYFMTEVQNDPPELEEGLENSGITAGLITTRLNHLPAETCEELTEVVGVHIDVHKRWLQWCAISRATGGVCSVIDYGKISTIEPDIVGEKVAVGKSLSALINQIEDAEWTDTLGRHHPLSLGLVDLGYLDDVVWDAIKDRPKWRGCKGFGASTQNGGGYRHPTATTSTKRPIGDHAYESKQANGEWEINMDTDHWIRLAHEMFLAETFDQTGSRRESSLALFGEDELTHREFARQCVAWVWTTKFERGKGLKTKLWPEHRDDHSLDNVYGALVACEAATKKLRRPRTAPKPEQPEQNPANPSRFRMLSSGVRPVLS